MTTFNSGSAAVSIQSSGLFVNLDTALVRPSVLFANIGDDPNAIRGDIEARRGTTVIPVHKTTRVKKLVLGFMPC